MVSLAVAVLAFQVFNPPGTSSAPVHPCSDLPHDAALIQQVDPKLPAGAQVNQAVPVIVQVTISPEGDVLGASIAQSSGNTELDQAVLNAAKASSYQPKVSNCNPTVGTYQFRWRFTPSNAAVQAANTCNRDGLVSNAARPAFPAGLHLEQPAATIVRVTIGTTGEVVDAKVEQSSGVPALDEAAVDAAKHSSFLPKMVSCKAVVASYTYKVVFNPH